MSRWPVTCWPVIRRSTQVSALLLSSAFLIGCATTPFGAPVDPQAAGDVVEAGYLPKARLEALAEAVPAPAAEGSPARIADRAMSDRYRAFEDSDRWLLATAHAELSPELARQHFDCALGVRFAGTPTPRLTAMFDRLLHDANAVAETAKALRFQPRPVAVDPQRRACTRLTDASRASASYPSGSASVGAAYGEAMAAVAPDKAAAAREIGRQIGVSRLVCGMHYPADVAAGEAVGETVFAEAARTPTFQSDLAAARIELATVRTTGLTNPGCAAERAALAAPVP